MTYWILEAYLPSWWAVSWKLTYHGDCVALGNGTRHGCLILEVPSWSLKAMLLGI